MPLYLHPAVWKYEKVFLGPEAIASNLQTTQHDSNLSLGRSLTQDGVREKAHSENVAAGIEITTAQWREWVSSQDLWEDASLLPRWLKRKFLIQEAALDEMITPGGDSRPPKVAADLRTSEPRVIDGVGCNYCRHVCADFVMNRSNFGGSLCDRSAYRFCSTKRGDTWINFGWKCRGGETVG